VWGARGQEYICWTLRDAVALLNADGLAVNGPAVADKIYNRLRKGLGSSHARRMKCLVMLRCQVTRINNVDMHCLYSKQTFKKDY
jgi:hypothetical protein